MSVIAVMKRFTVMKMLHLIDGYRVLRCLTEEEKQLTELKDLMVHIGFIDDCLTEEEKEIMFEFMTL